MAHQKSTPQHDPAPADAPPRCVCFIGRSEVEIWGTTPAQRSLKQLAPFRIHKIISEDDLAGITESVLLIRADAVIDVPLIACLIDEPGLLLIGDEHGVEKPIAVHAPAEHAEAAAKVLVDGSERIPVYLRLKSKRPHELDASYWKALRKREVPYALIVSNANLSAVEWRTFMGTYKGATDIVTKHVWPRPAFHVTRWLAPTAVTPNMVTAVSAVLVIAAFWLFLEGQFVAGIVAAWGMTFLDTVDGKLARVTLTSSKWGNIFDHGIDLVHPPFWYAAWAYGLSWSAVPLDPILTYYLLMAIVLGYILQRLMEGAAIAWLGLEIHIWRRIDTLFREITARRNPNLVLLSVCAIIGRPDWGLIAVAAWTVICLGLHAFQLLHAFIVKRRAGTLTSWMNRTVDAS